MYQEKIGSITINKKSSLLTVLVLLCHYLPVVSASQYSELCEKIAKNDMSDIYKLAINVPANAQIDINNNGIIDSVNCRRASLSMSCIFSEGRGGEYIGTVTEYGEGGPENFYEDIINYNNRNYVLTRVGSEKFNSPSSITMFTPDNERIICEFSGTWDEDAVRWNEKYHHLKNAFNSTLPEGIASPSGAPIEIITFERPTSIEPTFGGGFNVVRNYDFIDFNNDGKKEFVAEEIRVPALDSKCNNTHLVEVDKYGSINYTKSDVLYKLWDKVGQCGNPTFYFYFNNEFFIKTDNAILTIQGENLETVSDREKIFNVEKISYPSDDRAVETH